MTRSTRYLMVSALMVTGLAGTAQMAVCADETASTKASHVRSSNPAIRALIVEATRQSMTFRRMVEAIDASDSVVYVEEGTCGRSLLACFVNITGARGRRYLWVKIDVRRADADVMASIGHELRHTIEVLDAPDVTSSAGMFLFYTRVGSIGTARAFETAAAVRAGDTVNAELRKFRRAR